jgi:hypothetical protein
MRYWMRSLWRDLVKADRRQLQCYLRALETRYGPFADRVVFGQAVVVAESWWASRVATEAALREADRRRHGRGRRPKAQAVAARLKRRGLEVDTLDKQLQRLERLAGRQNGTPATPRSAAAAARAALARGSA